MRTFILTSVVGGFLASNLMAQGFNGFPKLNSGVPKLGTGVPKLGTPVPNKNTIVVPSMMQQPLVTQQTIVKPLLTTKPPVTIVTKPVLPPSVVNTHPLVSLTTNLNKIPTTIQPLTSLNGHKIPNLTAINTVPSNHGKTLSLNNLGKNVRFVLPDKTNQDISNIPGTGRVDPITEQSLVKAMGGESLSPLDRKLLSAQMFNDKLQPHEKAAISKALQEDLKEKQQMIPTVIVPPTIPTVIQPPVIIHNPPVVIPHQPLIVQPPTVQPPTVQPLTVQPPMGGSDIDTTTSTTEYGLQIKELGAAGAAQAAGLEKGDIIITVADQRVQSFDEMSKLLAQASGDVEIVIYRNGQLAKALVTPKSGKIGVAVDAVVVK